MPAAPRPTPAAAELPRDLIARERLLLFGDHVVEVGRRRADRLFEHGEQQLVLAREVLVEAAK